MTWYNSKEKPAQFSDLVGKTIQSISGLVVGNEGVFFETECGRTYCMEHQQDCCESVSIEEIHGDVEDLIGSVIVQAEGSVIDPPKEVRHPHWAENSETWTFYKLATNKGYVTIRWYGTSNGYYSESVDFLEVFEGGQ